MGEWDIDPPAKSGSSAEEPPIRALEGGIWSASLVRDASGSAEQGDQAPDTAPPRDPPPAGRRFRISYPWLTVALALLLVGILAGFYIGRAQYSEDSAALAEATARVGELRAALTSSEDRNWAYYRLNQALKEELDQARPTVATEPAAGGDRTTFGDGVYLVGEDIPAGTYDGVVNGTVGYWARLKGTDGAIASIIENGIPKGAFVLTIVPADKALELRGVTITLR